MCSPCFNSTIMTNRKMQNACFSRNRIWKPFNRAHLCISKQYVATEPKDIINISCLDMQITLKSKNKKHSLMFLRMFSVVLWCTWINGYQIIWHFVQHKCFDKTIFLTFQWEIMVISTAVISLPLTSVDNCTWILNQ